MLERSVLEKNSPLRAAEFLERALLEKSFPVREAELPERAVLENPLFQNGPFWKFFTLRVSPPARAAPNLETKGERI